MRGDICASRCGVTLSSFRAATRNPGAPARDYVNKSPACSLWTPHHVRGDTVRIGGGEALSSFRAATRNPGVPARDYVNKSPTYSLWAPHHVRGDTVRIGGGEALSSFRAATRNPGAPARDYVNKSPACSLWTPHRVRGDTTCSFFSAARRTNQKAPPLLSGYLARRLAPPSGAAELAALKQSSPSLLGRLASSRPDKGGGIATLHRKCPGHFAVRYPKIYRPISSFRATTRNPGIPGHGITQDARAVRPYSTLCHLQRLGPASCAGDTMRIGGREALSSFRAATRNPGVPARDYVNKSPTYSLWAPHHVRVTRLCSFFSAARRTNQEAPPLLSGYLARRLAPPSGAAELAALKQSSPSLLGRLASSRPDKGGGIATLHRKCPGHFAVRYPKIYRPISSFRATTRNPEIPGHGITQDARAMRHYSTLCHPEAGPRVECGVTQCASRVG